MHPTDPIYYYSGIRYHERFFLHRSGFHCDPTDRDNVSTEICPICDQKKSLHRSVNDLRVHYHLRVTTPSQTPERKHFKQGGPVSSFALHGIHVHRLLCPSLSSLSPKNWGFQGPSQRHHLARKPAWKWPRRRSQIRSHQLPPDFLDSDHHSANCLIFALWVLLGSPRCAEKLYPPFDIGRRPLPEVHAGPIRLRLATSQIPPCTPSSASLPNEDQRRRGSAVGPPSCYPHGEVQRDCRHFELQEDQYRRIGLTRRLLIYQALSFACPIMVDFANSSLVDCIETYSITALFVGYRRELNIQGRNVYCTVFIV